MKSKLVILLFCIVSIFITLNRGLWKEHQCIYWDGTGYYMYLPAFLTEHDPWQLHFYKHIDRVYEPSGSVYDYGIQNHPETGRRSIKYPMGVALFELPLFTVAHSYTKAFTHEPTDGYSAYYQLAVALSTIMWVMFGMIFLRLFLLRHYQESVVWLCLLLVAFGTNLYHYTAFFPGWSHSYSFFLFAVILYLTECWYRTGRNRYVIGIGVALGLAVITRPTNCIILLIPLLYQISNQEDVRHRLIYFGRHFSGILVSAVLCMAIVSLQLCYWKYSSGHWIFDSYDNERFDFLHPHLWEGFFSYRKGWFIYTPLALLMLCGFIPLYYNHWKLFLSLILYIALQIYIVFSWKIWHYAGCFSCRPMVESLAVLAIPAAAIIESIQQKATRIIRVAAITMSTCLIFLNLFQTYQYSLRVIHYDRMTKAYYWRVFGKLKATEEDRKLLRQPEEDLPDN